MLSTGYDRVPVKFHLQTQLTDQTVVCRFWIGEPWGDDCHEDEEEEDTEAVS